MLQAMNANQVLIAVTIHAKPAKIVVAAQPIAVVEVVIAVIIQAARLSTNANIAGLIVVTIHANTAKIAAIV